MLGGEQSGHIEAIGFEMYTTMLGEAVAKLKGEDGPTEETATLNLGISLRIDATYIPEENQRLRMYKKIAGAPDEATLEDVRAELADRYGDIPDAVKNLLAAGEIRIHCERLGIASLERKRTAIEDPKPAAKPAPTINGRQSIPGRYGQAPVHNPLQHTYRAVASRPRHQRDHGRPRHRRHPPRHPRPGRKHQAYARDALREVHREYPRSR